MSHPPPSPPPPSCAEEPADPVFAVVPAVCLSVCVLLLLQNIASISAGNDDSVGEMIADALDKVGSNGVLSIESSNR